MLARTDRNNNPAAFTTDIAKQAGLIEKKDYIQGDSFHVTTPGPGDTQETHVYYTAKLIGNPIELTIKVLDAIGYYTKYGMPRWTYMAIPKELWLSFSKDQKILAVAAHYRNEGGELLKPLFVKPINLTVGDHLSMDASVKNG